MTHWTRNYVLAVLDEKNWSMNRLATEIGVAATTINRPLKSDDPSKGLSAKIVSKIYNRTGISPSDYAPTGMSEPIALFMEKPLQPRTETTADRALAKLLEAEGGQRGQANSSPMRPEAITIATSGKFARVSATVDKEGLKTLIKKLQALEVILDD